MSPIPIQVGGAQVDLSPRYYYTETVVASPSAATETIIATLTIDQDIALVEAVRLAGYAAFTVGTSGVSANLRIRRTDVSGTIVKASGAVTVVAGNLYAPAIVGMDEGLTVLNQVYVLTLTIGSGAAAASPWGGAPSHWAWA